MTSAVCTLVFAAQLSMGCGFGGHHHGRPVIVAPATIVRTVPEPVVVSPPPVSCCDTCGVRFSVVDAEIYRMQHDPRWRKRDNAANHLRDYDWQCHPQIVPALVTTMLRDCHEEVREEAAESLAKMAPCLPEVHAALRKSALCDPDHATRKWARRGLERVARKCEGPCSICGPVESGVLVGPISQPGSVIIEGPMTFEPPLAVEPMMPGVPGATLPLNEGPMLEPLPPPDPTPAPLPPPTLIPPLPPGAGETSPLGPPPEARRSGGRVASLDRDAKVQRVSSRDEDKEEDDDDHRDRTPGRSSRKPLLSIFRIGR